MWTQEFQHGNSCLHRLFIRRGSVCVSEVGMNVALDLKLEWLTMNLYSLYTQVRYVFGAFIAADIFHIAVKS